MTMATASIPPSSRKVSLWPVSVWGDKFSRFKTLSRLSCNDRDQQQVTDESIRDTLLDLANYAIMTVLEMDTPDESHATLYAYDKPIYTVEEDK